MKENVVKEVKKEKEIKVIVEQDKSEEGMTYVSPIELRGRVLESLIKE